MDQTIFSDVGCHLITFKTGKFAAEGPAETRAPKSLQL